MKSIRDMSLTQEMAFRETWRSQGREAVHDGVHFTGYDIVYLELPDADWETKQEAIEGWKAGWREAAPHQFTVRSVRNEYGSHYAWEYVVADADAARFVEERVWSEHERFGSHRVDDQYWITGPASEG